MASVQTILRKRIWATRKHVCNICHKEIKDAKDFILDHVIARGLGGPRYDLANLQILCKECNEIKDRLDFAKIHGKSVDNVINKYIKKKDEVKLWDG